MFACVCVKLTTIPVMYTNIQYIFLESMRGPDVECICNECYDNCLSFRIFRVRLRRVGLDNWIGGGLDNYVYAR